MDAGSPDRRSLGRPPLESSPRPDTIMSPMRRFQPGTSARWQSADGSRSPAVGASPGGGASPYASRTASAGRPAGSPAYSPRPDSDAGSFHSARSNSRRDASSPAPGAAAQTPVSGADAFRPKDVDSIMRVMNTAMERISDLDGRCEDERRSRLEMERRVARLEAELTQQNQLSLRKDGDAAQREATLQQRVTTLEAGAGEARDALEALCDTVEWSATNDSVRAGLDTLEALLLEQLEGVDSSVRTELSARLDTHEDLLNELGTEVDNFAATAQGMVDELRVAATGVLDGHAESISELQEIVDPLRSQTEKLEKDSAVVQEYLHGDLNSHLDDLDGKLLAAEEKEVRRVKHVHDEVESLSAQVGRTEASHIAAMEDVALAVAQSNRGTEDMRQFIDQTQADLQVHSLAQKLAFEDIHSKLEIMEDPSGFLDRLRSLTTSADGSKSDASEIARAIDFMLERLTNLENQRDALSAQQDNAAGIAEMVDAKILAGAVLQRHF